jgi:hypothetical protein
MLNVLLSIGKTVPNDVPSGPGQSRLVLDRAHECPATGQNTAQPLRGHVGGIGKINNFDAVHVKALFQLHPCRVPLLVIANENLGKPVLFPYCLSSEFLAPKAA